MPFTAVPSHIGQIEPECFLYLKQHSTLKILKEGDFVCKMEQIGVDFVIVKSGLLVVEKLYPEDLVVPVQFVPPTRGFAPSPTPDAPAVFQMRALADSEVTCIPANTVYGACLKFPQFGQALVASVVQRTNDGYLAQARIAKMPPQAQIAHLFWWLAMEEPLQPDGSKYLPWKLSQQMLATYMGKAREEVNRKMKWLADEGHLRKAEKGYYLNASLKKLFDGYGEPSKPVAFIASGSALTATMG